MAAISEPTTTTRTRPRYVAPVLPQVAAVYTRVSTKKQADADELKTSLETQEAGCRNLATADGFPINPTHVYPDMHSGEELYERPQLTLLREAAKRREFSRVYVYRIDRLSRDPIHLGIVLGELERLGIRVKFVIDELDDSDEGQLVRYVKGYAGKIDNARRKEQSMRAIHERAVRGGYISGCRPPYGYTWGQERHRDGRLMKVRLVIYPVTARVVVRIFTEVAAGKTLRRLAMDLIADGVPSPTGRTDPASWDPGTLRYLLRNPLYWGQPIALRYRNVPVEKALRDQYASASRTIPRDADDQVPLPEGVAPAIVSMELATQVDVRLRLNKQMATRNNRQPEVALLRGGIARCGYCHGTLAAGRLRKPLRTQPDRVRILYRCRANQSNRARCQAHGVETHLLDTAAWAKVHEVMNDPKIIEDEYARACETDDPGAETLATIDSQIADRTRRIRGKRQLAEYVTDETETRELAAEIDHLAAERRGLERERVAAEHHYARFREQREGLARVLDMCRRWSENLDNFTQAERRELLITLKAEVLLYRSDHDPRAQLILNLPLSGAVPLDLDLSDRGVAHCGKNAPASSHSTCAGH